MGKFSPSSFTKCNIIFTCRFSSLFRVGLTLQDYKQLVRVIVKFILPLST
jgi:hypothetical protein